jgi:cell division protein FtsB
MAKQFTKEDAFNVANNRITELEAQVKQLQSENELLKERVCCYEKDLVGAVRLVDDYLTLKQENEKLKNKLELAEKLLRG